MNQETHIETLKLAYEEPCMPADQINQLKQTIEKAKSENLLEKRRKNHLRTALLAGAAALLLVILPNTSPTIAHAMEQIPLLDKLVSIVTFRDYQYEDERNQANLNIPEMIAETDSTLSDTRQDTLQNTMNEINTEIHEIAEGFITTFEENLEKELGYQNIGIDYEIINTTSDYFTLKLICYQVSGSGTQWNYYYTIDLTTGERLHLSELFAENTDYITPISDNIKKQMQEQMDADANVFYWLNHEIEAWNFKQITDQTAFYINENGNIVISFNEGDVAPMYMGIVTFEIPAEVTENIRK